MDIIIFLFKNNLFCMNNKYIEVDLPSCHNDLNDILISMVTTTLSFAEISFQWFTEGSKSIYIMPFSFHIVNCACDLIITSQRHSVPFNFLFFLFLYSSHLQ